ncbi:MAG: hypothetical protein IJN02_09830 [Bacteroidales bacterium]|nr:hypothetical protein [Bacteroidales bacterium]
MSMTLSERFQEIAYFCLGSKVKAANIYKVHDCIGNNKVISAVSVKKIELHRLVHIAMTDRLYGKYKNYYVVCECIDGFGFRIEGTITYEIRHDYIPAKDGDDA